jgi:hypothetical protein
MNNIRAIESAKAELRINITKLTGNITRLEKKLKTIDHIGKMSDSNPLSPATSKEYEQWMMTSPHQAMIAMNAFMEPHDKALKDLVATLKRNVKFEKTIRESLQAMLTSLELNSR